MIRAPQASEAAGHGPTEAPGPPWMPRAFGLGATELAAVTAPSLSGSVREEVVDPPAGEAPAPAWEAVAPRPGATRPASADDKEGIYKSLLWMAWAVEECSRAYTALASRVSKIEARLDLIEADGDLSRTPPTVAPHVSLQRQAPFDHAEGALARLAARVDEIARETGSRVDAVEERSRQASLLPLKVSNLQREIDRLAAEQRAARLPDSEVNPRPSTTEWVALRAQVADTNRRVSSVEGLLSEAALAALVEEAVIRHSDRFGTETASSTVDVEGVYRELDRVAEFVTARAASTAETLERLGPLEVAVLELRRDLDRSSGDRGSSRALKHELRELSSRMEHVEAAGEKIERLYSALEALLTGEREGPFGSFDTSGDLDQSNV